MCNCSVNHVREFLIVPAEKAIHGWTVVVIMSVLLANVPEQALTVDGPLLLCPDEIC